MCIACGGVESRCDRRAKSVREEQRHALAQASLTAHNELLENLLAREREQPAQPPDLRSPLQQPLTLANIFDREQVACTCETVSLMSCDG